MRNEEIKMELRVLRYFLMVVSEGSISRAASKLHITQPTISRQLAELEKELKTELFLHNKHPLTLTSEGLRFYQHASEIVFLADRTEQEFTRQGQKISGIINIGVVEAMGAMILPDIIADYTQKYPEVQFSLYTGFADDIREKLDTGLLDMGILVEPVEYQNYETFPLPATDLWGVLLHVEHPLAGEETLTLEALHNLPLIIPQRALSLEGKRNWLGNALKNASVIATYNILSNAALLVNKGLGCAVCLYGGALPRLSAETRFIPFSPERVSKSVFVWKKGYKYNPASEIFIQDLKLFFTKNKA